MIIYLKFIVVIAIIAIGAGVFKKVDDIFVDLPMSKIHIYIAIMVFVFGVILVSVIAFLIWLFMPEITALQQVQGAVK